MNKIIILFAAAALGCAGCQQDIVPISPEATTADRVLAPSDTSLLKLRWSESGALDWSFTRFYLPQDFKLVTPQHGAQLWPDKDPNLVLWQSVGFPGMATIDLPPLPNRRYRLAIIARVRRTNPTANPQIFICDTFDGKPSVIFQPTTEFKSMVSPIIFTRARKLYFVYAAGSYDDRDTNIDIRAAFVAAAGR